MADRFRGQATALGAALVLSWLPWAVDPGSGVLAPIVQSIVFSSLAVATAVCPRAKVVTVRTLQRLVVNPLVRALLAVGINPLGLVVIETRGRVSGRPRRTPVGSGTRDGVLWIVAEHGSMANWVRNIGADPAVRVLMRRGLRHRWVVGHARVVPDDDPIVRQRLIVGRNVLRAVNAMNVRLLGAELMTVRVDLAPVPVPLPVPLDAAHERIRPTGHTFV